MLTETHFVCTVETVISVARRLTLAGPFSGTPVGTVDVARCSEQTKIVNTVE